MNRNIWISILMWFSLLVSLALKSPHKLPFWYAVCVVGAVGFVLPSLQHRLLQKWSGSYLIPTLSIILLSWKFDSLLIMPLGFFMVSYTVTLGYAKTPKGFFDFLILGGAMLFLSIGYQGVVVSKFPEGVFLSAIYLVLLMFLSLSYKAVFDRTRETNKMAFGLATLSVAILPALLLGTGTGVLREHLKVSENPLEQTTDSYKTVFTATFYDKKMKNISSSYKPGYWIDEYYDYPYDGFRWRDLNDVMVLSEKNDIKTSMQLLPYRSKNDIEEEKGGDKVNYFVRRKKGINPRIYGTLLAATKYYEVDSVNGDGSITSYYGAVERPIRKEHDEMPENIKNIFLSFGKTEKQENKNLTPKKPLKSLMDREANRLVAKELAPKTFALSEELRKGALTDEQYMYRVITYFKKNLKYNFDYQSKKPEKNMPDHFLFEDKKGVCRHFANSFALMMRMQGVPTRIVTGWRDGGFHDTKKDEKIIKMRDAHVWTEVWLNNKWYLIDPTDHVPVEKGIPVRNDGWLDMGGLVSLAKRNGFSTEGEAGEEGKNNKKSLLKAPVVPNIPFSFFAGLGILGFSLFMFLTWPKHPEKEWARMLERARMRGWGDLRQYGPQTAMEKMAQNSKNPEMLMSLGRRYERYLYAEGKDKGLAKAIRKARGMM